MIIVGGLPYFVIIVCGLADFLASRNSHPPCQEGLTFGREMGSHFHMLVYSMVNTVW